MPPLPPSPFPGVPDPGAVTVVLAAPEEPVRIALGRFLEQERFTVRAVSTLEEATAALGQGPAGCLLLERALLGSVPGLGVERLLEADRHLGILVITDVSDTEAAEAAVAAGAIGHLVKPVDLADLLQAVRRTLRHRDAHLEGERLSHRLREEVALRTAELQRERENLQQVSVATLEALVNALEAKDPHLRGHSTRVSELAGQVAEAMGLEPATVEIVRTAGRLHDIGKIGIREAVLGKQGPLTDQEFAHIKTHAELGARILAPLRHLGAVIGCVRSHHERWDGTGYPDGLAGAAIPIGARIIGAVEIFDALTTSRPYQQTMTPAAAVRRMEDLAGSVIDPEVHAALGRVMAA